MIHKLKQSRVISLSEIHYTYSSGSSIELILNCVKAGMFESFKREYKLY